MEVKYCDVCGFVIKDKKVNPSENYLTKESSLYDTFSNYFNHLSPASIFLPPKPFVCNKQLCENCEKDFQKLCESWEKQRREQVKHLMWEQIMQKEKI